MKLINKQPIRLENNLNDIREIAGVCRQESLNSDLIKMFIGSHIGSGAYRSVFEFNLNPQKYVIKLEHGNTSSNINEFTVWNEVSWLVGDSAWIKDWFAPIYYMSPDGKLLIQERTKTDIPKGVENYPDKVPDFLSDIKLDNFGWIDKRFVCHDYGIISRMIKFGSKMNKVKW